MATGGSIRTILLDGRPFSAPFDLDLEVNPGGRGGNNEVEANGDNSSRLIMEATPGMISGVIVSIDSQTDDLAFLRDLANSGEFFDVSIIRANGTAIEGSAAIVGGVKESTQKTTATFDLKADGVFEPDA